MTLPHNDVASVVVELLDIDDNQDGDVHKDFPPTEYGSYSLMSCLYWSLFTIGMPFCNSSCLYNRPVPVHEFVQSASFLDNFMSWTQP